MTTHLKVVRIQQDPPLVLDHHVPIFTESPDLFQPEQWDLTTQKVSCHHIKVFSKYELDLSNNNFF